MDDANDQNCLFHPQHSSGLVIPEVHTVQQHCEEVANYLAVVDVLNELEQSMFSTEFLFVVIDLHLKYLEGLKKLLDFCLTVRAINSIFELFLSLLGKVDGVTCNFEVVQQQLRFTSATLLLPMLHLLRGEVANYFDSDRDLAEQLPRAYDLLIESRLPTAVSVYIDLAILHEYIDHWLFE